MPNISYNSKFKWLHFKSDTGGEIKAAFSIDHTNHSALLDIQMISGDLPSSELQRFYASVLQYCSRHGQSVLFCNATEKVNLDQLGIQRSNDRVMVAKASQLKSFAPVSKYGLVNWKDSKPQESDLSALQSVFARTYWAQKYSLQEILERINESTIALSIISPTQVPVGIVLFQATGRSGYIYDMAIHESLRGQRFGKHLFSGLSNVIKGSRFTGTINLIVAREDSAYPASHLRARSIYSQHGFLPATPKCGQGFFHVPSAIKMMKENGIKLYEIHAIDDKAISQGHTSFDSRTSLISGNTLPSYRSNSSRGFFSRDNLCKAALVGAAAVGVAATSYLAKKYSP